MAQDRRVRPSRHLPAGGALARGQARRQREALAQQQRELLQGQQSLQAQISRLQAQLAKGDELAARTSEAVGEVGAQVNDVQRGARAARRAAREAVWAAVFHDTVRGSAWLTQRALSPGRWAVGYPFLYVLYRVLDEVKPAAILELGLGQSTKMTAQYAAAGEDVQHTVVEHHQEWIDNFATNFALPDGTQVRRLDLTTVDSDGEDLLRYEGFAAAVGQARYDLIVIDGPFGGGATRARMDVLDLIPAALADRFVIALDDYNRPGEKVAAAAIVDALEAAGVAHETAVYGGEKEMWVATSPDLKFFTTL